LLVVYDNLPYGRAAIPVSQLSVKNRIYGRFLSVKR
jgi:hypothetical protein